MSGDLFSHLYRNLARMEKATADVRGTLLAGTDPTGIGCVTSGHSAKRALDRLGVSLTVIGMVDARTGIRLIDGARSVRLEGAGYDHFR